MPKNYNTDIVDPANTIKACLTNAQCSFKNTRETAAMLRGRSVDDTMRYLNNVIEKKECVLMRRYATGTGNTRQARRPNILLQPESVKHIASRGRWPKKSAETLITLFNNVKNNAHLKKIDPSELVIKMISVNKAPKVHGRIYRAFGRVNAFNKSPCHIQVVCVRRGTTISPDADLVEVE